MGIPDSTHRPQNGNISRLKTAVTFPTAPPLLEWGEGFLPGLLVDLRGYPASWGYKTLRMAEYLEQCPSPVPFIAHLDDILQSAMVNVKRFRSNWGIEPSPGYENYKSWFAKLKQQGYG